MTTATLNKSDIPAAPFDTVARDYDAEFAQHRLGRWLRARVWQCLDGEYRSGDNVIDLGCGTGEDAVHLAARGVNVRAIDSSPRMLAVAREKAAAAGVAAKIQFEQRDIGDIGSKGARAGLFDGAYSNFGALNCIRNRAGLADALATHIRIGGRLVLVVMGPFCPWEWAWYIPRGQVRTAFRRLGNGTTASLNSGASTPVWYPSSSRLRREFEPHFRAVRTTGLGVALPPTFASSLVDKWPRLFRKLADVDRLAGSVFPGTWLNDHYMIVFERTEATT